jgi:hypothetical protein
VEVGEKRVQAMRKGTEISAIDLKLSTPAGPLVVIARKLCGNRHRRARSLQVACLAEGYTIE